MESPEDLFQRYYQPVVGFFRRRGFSAEESRDLAQETFLRVFRSIDTFRGRSSVATWVFTIATHVRMNALRERDAAKRRGAEEHLLSEAGDNPDDRSLVIDSEALPGMLAEERVRVLREALRELPPQMRRCVELALADMSYRETAELMRISIQTVRSQLFEARRRLKPILEEYFADEELRG